MTACPASMCPVIRKLIGLPLQLGSATAVAENVEPSLS